MKKNTNLTALVLLLSLALFSPFVSGQVSEVPEEDAAVESPQASRDFLGLTPEQKAKLEELRKSEREKSRASFEEMRKVRAEMKEMMKGIAEDFGIETITLDLVNPSFSTVIS